MRRVSRFCAGSLGSRACAVSDAVLFRCSLLVLVYVMFFRFRALGRRSSGSVAPFVCAVVVVVVVVLVGLLVVCGGGGGGFGGFVGCVVCEKLYPPWGSNPRPLD